MEININSISDFTRNAEILWTKGNMSVDPVARKSGLFKELAIPQLSGNTREFSEIELNEYARKKGESDQATRAKVQQGYTKIGTLKRIASDIGISYEMRTQGKYPEMVSKLTNLGSQAAKRLELDLQHRVTFGIATTYVDMDGDTVNIAVGDTLALFSTAHTLRGSSTTFRNRLANNPQVSKGAIEAVQKQAIENSYNQFGEKMTMTYDVLWTTDDPATINTVKEILRSTSNPTQNNPSVINAQQGSYRHIILPRVATTNVGAVDSTKAKYWGIASTEYSTAYLGVHEEARLKSPTVGSNAEEFSTDDWNYGSRAGYMVVVVSANWIHFSSGTAEA